MKLISVVLLTLFFSLELSASEELDSIERTARSMVTFSPTPASFILDSKQISTEALSGYSRIFNYNDHMLGAETFISVLTWTVQSCLYLPYLANGPHNLTHDEIHQRSKNLAEHLYSAEGVTEFSYVAGQFLGHLATRALWTAECALGIKKGEAVLLLQGITIE
jgi:hypothetical protein